MSTLYQNSTKDGLTGYALTKPSNTSRLRTVYNKTKGIKTVRPGMAKIGAGVQGVVFLAGTSSRGERNLVIKVSPADKSFTMTNQPAEAEYKIQKALYKIAPRHIARPIRFFRQDNYVPIKDFDKRNTKIFDYSKQMVMFSEYAHGGSLKDWLHKMGKRLTDRDMAYIIKQVITTMKRIHTRYPEFRHNDSHLGNFLVDDTGSKPRIMFADFGLSRLTLRGSNPLINTNAHKGSGISARTSYKYDAHYFLNALNIEIRHGLPETRDFLSRVLPDDYRGSSTVHVANFRLKNGANTGPLPTFNQILADPFLSPSASSVRKPARVAAITPNSSIRNIFKTPSKNAADIAASALAGLSGVAVSTTARRPTAAEFLRMSPRSRAALMMRPRGENSRTVIVRNVVRTRGANIVRESSRRVAAPGRYMAFNGGGVGARVATRVVRSPIRPAPRSSPRVSPRPTSGPAPRSSPRPASGARALAEILPSERRRFEGVLAVARRAAARNIRNRGGVARRSGLVTSILNAYANSVNNQRTLTRRMLKAKLTSNGFTANQANTYVRAWEQKWLNTRGNVNAATRNARAGKNLNKRGYTPGVAVIARRRAAENLSKGPNGRVRKGKALLESKKKDELIAMARRQAVPHTSKMTKQQLVNALFG